MKKSRTTLPYLEKYDETITHPLSLRHASPDFINPKNWNALTRKNSTRRERGGAKSSPRDPTVLWKCMTKRQWKPDALSRNTKSKNLGNKPWPFRKSITRERSNESIKTSYWQEALGPRHHTEPKFLARDPTLKMFYKAATTRTRKEPFWQYSALVGKV